MEFKELKELIQVINESSLTTFEIEKEGFRVTLKKEVNYVATAAPAPVQAPAVMPQVAVQATPATPVVDTAAAVNPESEKLSVVTSPIVGTFYGSSSPGSPAFVKVGDVVKKGQTLCIIEAMKLMNEIESEFDGTIVEVCVQNEQMVEFNTPLFKIRP